MRKSLMIVLFLAVPGTAFAQDAELVFHALDGDSNGQVSQQEAAANELVSANFAAADSNSDGALTLAEFTAAFGG